jgi:hypothetical protein
MGRASVCCVRGGTNAGVVASGTCEGWAHCESGAVGHTNVWGMPNQTIHKCGCNCCKVAPTAD